MQKFSRKETDGRNSLWRIREVREPSDLTEEQGSYGEYSQRFKLRRGRTVDPSRQGPLDLHVDSISGFRRLKSRNLCNGTREIMKREVPKGQKDCVGHRIGRWTGGALSTRKSIR
jgi:hypothetical protein